MPLSAKERQQRWRDKKKPTPEGLLAYRQSEHDRYERRKQLGSRKLVKDLSTREHRMQMRLETKASSPAGQCIPAGYHVTLPRRVLITKSVITTTGSRNMAV